MYNNIDIDTSNNEEGSGSGRGAKGSLRDRIISILLRRRYEKFRLQKEFYTKSNLEDKIKYIRRIKNFDIEKLNELDEEDKNVIGSMEFIIPVIPAEPKKVDIYIPDIDYDKFELGDNLDDSTFSEQGKILHEASEKIINSDPMYEIDGRAIPVDPETEVFDFDKYDYYELEDIKKGIDIKDLSDDDKEILDIEKEEDKAKDEKVIVEEITKFIDESLVVLEEIKEEVSIIQEEVEKPYTMEQALELEARNNKLREKIEKLKAQYETVKDKYDFSDFAILDSIEIMIAVDDYLDKAKLDNIEVMVNVCKNEISKIEGIVIENERDIKVVTDIEKKKEEITDRTIAFDENNKKRKKEESKLEDLVAYELVEQRKILEDIKRRINHIEEVNIPQIRITGYGRMFASMLRIAAGILTVPLSRNRIFGVALGTSLINRGLRGLRQGLTMEQTNETVVHYEDLEREIINCKDRFNYIDTMLIDSIEQVNKLKNEFHDRFEKYIYLIPEYKESMVKLDLLKKKLEQKHVEVKAHQKDLDMQRARNNQRIRTLYRDRR